MSSSDSSDSSFFSSFFSSSLAERENKQKKDVNTACLITCDVQWCVCSSVQNFKFEQTRRQMQRTSIWWIIGKSTYLGRLHQQREQLHQRQEQEQHHQLPRCRSGYRCPRCSEPETLHINTASSCWVCTRTEELVILPRNPCCNAQKSNITGRPLKTPPCLKCSDFTWRLSVDKHDTTRISCSSVGHG